MVPETLKKLYITTWFYEKTFFAPKIGEMGQKWPKKGFLNLKEYLLLHKSFKKNLVPEI